MYYKQPKNTENKHKFNFYRNCTIMHLLLSMFALYISFSCNNGVDPLHITAALVLPYVYIPYMLATQQKCATKVFYQ
jgi:hypothetical protein